MSARLSPVARLDAEEAYVQAATDAIGRRHPHGGFLVHKRASDMNDTTLVEATRRLRAWLDDPNNATERG